MLVHVVVIHTHPLPINCRAKLLPHPPPVPFTQALAMYDVKANETTWEAVCEAAICDPALAIALNPNTTLVAEARVIVPTIG